MHEAAFLHPFERCGVASALDHVDAAGVKTHSAIVAHGIVSRTAVSLSGLEADVASVKSRTDDAVIALEQEETDVPPVVDIFIVVDVAVVDVLDRDRDAAVFGLDFFKAIAEQVEGPGDGRCCQGNDQGQAKRQCGVFDSLISSHVNLVCILRSVNTAQRDAVLLDWVRLPLPASTGEGLLIRQEKGAAGRCKARCERTYCEYRGTDGAMDHPWSGRWRARGRGRQPGSCLRK